MDKTSVVGKEKLIYYINNTSVHWGKESSMTERVLLPVSDLDSFCSFFSFGQSWHSHQTPQQ
jgi:hypothetical protein